MRRFSDGEWAFLPTENVSEDDHAVYYIAKTPGFSYFAITSREGITPSYGFMHSTSSFLQPYTLVGAFYNFAKFGEAKGKIPLTIANLDLKTSIKSVSGVGPTSGSYSATIAGLQGQPINVGFGSQSLSLSLPSQNIIRLDFMRLPFTDVYVPIAKGSILSYLNPLSLIAVVAVLGVFGWAFMRFRRKSRISKEKVPSKESDILGKDQDQK